jgi:hypothetical protein
VVKNAQIETTQDVNDFVKCWKSVRVQRHGAVSFSNFGPGYRIRNIPVKLYLEKTGGILLAAMIFPASLRIARNP